jgi:Ca-activated chloride channel family protein
MKTRKAMLMALGLVLLPVFGYGADKGIRIEGRVNCPMIAHHGGKVYLQIAVKVPATDTPRRRPMNLSVVLDRSGSMADEGKYEFAKRAVRVLIDQLQEEDIFSLVVYDDVITVLRDAKRVGNKHELKRLLDDVGPRGATNLGGGLVEGLKQAERYRSREYLNRVILLSDGLANRGVTDPYELRSIARRYRARSISITTMGVGLEYNENLMVGLSESGGGNYYFIESPRTLASMFQKELDEFNSVVAQNASVELSLGEGVRVLDVICFEHNRESGRVVIQVGDLISGERRELTVELEVPPGSGRIRLASGTLRYDGTIGWFESWPSFTTWIRYTKDFAEIDRNRDGEVQSKADVAISTRVVDKALQALDQGRRADAVREIREAKAAVEASLVSGTGGAASVLQEQRGRLEKFEMQLNDSADAKRAKKSIQFENYRVQKKR